MLEHVVTIILEILIPICELIGIFVVAVSALSAFLHYLYGLIKKDAYDIKFQLANGLALRLEFKMAAEILKTVSVRDFEELTVLAIVIVLRALLSFLIHFEMKHRN
jgi:uncharacterized membrane protein